MQFIQSNNIKHGTFLLGIEDNLPLAIQVIWQGKQTILAIFIKNMNLDYIFHSSDESRSLYDQADMSKPKNAASHLSTLHLQFLGVKILCCIVTIFLAYRTMETM